MSAVCSAPLRTYARAYLGSSLMDASRSALAADQSISLMRAVARLVQYTALSGARLMASEYSAIARGKSPALNASFPRALASSALVGSRYAASSARFFSARSFLSLSETSSLRG